MTGSIDENRKKDLFQEIDLLINIFSILVVIFQNCSDYYIKFAKISSYLYNFRSSHQRCLKKVLLKIFQNSQENTCARA